MKPTPHRAPSAPSTRLASALVLAGASAALLSACGAGPRMKQLAPRQYSSLDAEQRIDVYVGNVQVKHEDVAIIESDASAYVDTAVKERQLAQLREKARRLGANAIQDVRILTKHVEGYTPDERVPFTSWEQGHYDLYFMRATAVRMPEDEPGSLDEIRPKSGWVVDKHQAPQKLETVLGTIPSPGLRTQ